MKITIEDRKAKYSHTVGEIITLQVVEIEGSEGVWMKTKNNPHAVPTTSDFVCLRVGRDDEKRTGEIAIFYDYLKCRVLSSELIVKGASL